MSFGQVLKYKEAALAPDGEVEIAIAVDIRHGNLHAPAHAASVVDNMPRPHYTLAVFRLMVLVPINAQRVALAGIVAVVRHETLAGKQSLASVTVEVHQRQCMRLRPRFVDHVLHPGMAGSLDRKS